MADYIGATPIQNPLMGLLAERLKQAQEFAVKPFGYSNPPAEMIMNLLGVPAVQQTAERLAYGEPLTTGRGMTTQIRPEAVEAALTVAPVAGLLGKGAETATMAAGRAGERYAEKVVPQIMERGGLPAQLLGDLAQGSRRQIFVPASQEEALQAAKLLRKKTPEEVWKETGVAKFGDDFVKEISDKESSFNTAADIHESAEKIRQRNAELKQILNESRSTYPDLFPKELTAARRPLREEIKANQGLLEMPRGYVSDSSFSGNMAAIAYEHPELYKQVPEMKGVVIRQGRDLGDFLGAYENSPSRPLGSIDITKLGLKNDPRSTATHEMQHAVQEFYGLPGGGTPEEFMREAIADRNLLNSKIDDLNKKMREVSGTPEYDKIMEQRMALTQEYLDKGYGDMASVYKNASDQYQRLAGEAQSRLAQTRIDLTPEERRQYFPFAYGKENYGLDVKPEDLIFRQGGLLGQSKASFDVTKKDASELFGAGAQRVMYQDPKSGGAMEVLVKPDGTASVLSLEVPETSRGKGIGQSLQAQVMQDYPEMMGQVSSKAAAKTAYRLGRRPPFKPDATLEDVYKMMDEDSSVNLVSPEMQKRFRQSLLY